MEGVIVTIFLHKKGLDEAAIDALLMLRHDIFRNTTERTKELSMSQRRGVRGPKIHKLCQICTILNVINVSMNHYHLQC